MTWRPVVRALAALLTAAAAYAATLAIRAWLAPDILHLLSSLWWLGIALISGLMIPAGSYMILSETPRPETWLQKSVTWRKVAVQLGKMALLFAYAVSVSLFILYRWHWPG